MLCLVVSPPTGNPHPQWLKHNVVHVPRKDHPLSNLVDIHTYFSLILMCMLATICFNEASQATVRRARDMLNLSREHSKNPGHRFMRRENAASTWGFGSKMCSRMQ